MDALPGEGANTWQSVQVEGALERSELPTSKRPFSTRHLILLISILVVIIGYVLYQHLEAVVIHYIRKKQYVQNSNMYELLDTMIYKYIRRGSIPSTMKDRLSIVHIPGAEKLSNSKMKCNLQSQPN